MARDGLPVFWQVPRQDSAWATCSYLVDSRWRGFLGPGVSCGHSLSASVKWVTVSGPGLSGPSPASSAVPIRQLAPGKKQDAIGQEPPGGSRNGGLGWLFWRRLGKAEHNPGLRPKVKCNGQSQRRYLFSCGLGWEWRLGAATES